MTKELATADVEVGDGRPSIREANVEAFLDAAERLLIREGAAGISTRQLAREAGQNHGLVHYYFGSVDELLLQTLERFTARILDRQRAMYGADAPFTEKWRTAMGFIEEDLASGYPKIWARAGGDRLEQARAARAPRTTSPTAGTRCSATHSPRRSRSTASTGTGFSAEAWATLVMQFNKGLLHERLLGFDRGHAELLASIDAWLSSLDAEKGHERHDKSIREAHHGNSCAVRRDRRPEARAVRLPRGR